MIISYIPRRLLSSRALSSRVLSTRALASILPSTNATSLYSSHWKPFSRFSFERFDCICPVSCFHGTNLFHGATRLLCIHDELTNAPPLLRSNDNNNSSSESWCLVTQVRVSCGHLGFVGIYLELPYQRRRVERLIILAKKSSKQREGYAEQKK